MPESLDSSQRLLDFMSQAHQLPSVVGQQKALKALTLAFASFTVALKWEGVGRHVLRLQGSVPAGRLRVLAGEYAGVEHYVIAALQTTRGKENLTPALHGLFRVFQPSYLHEFCGCQSIL